MAKILIIDDSEGICRIFTRFVIQMGHSADQAYSLEEGLAKTRRESFDLVLLDVRLPDGNGLDIIPDLLNSAGAPDVIIITGDGDADGAELAIRSGAWAYIEKPPAQEMLSLQIARALQYREQKARARSPVVMKRGGIIGSSPALTTCLEQASKAASTDVNVLLTGETGTGKELFARAIHANSQRAAKMFITVDCAALTETLAESILFGHVKGAFTGADKDRRGLIREAHGGTLFLDEIGELSPDLQKAFLRMLQEKRFRPVGSEKEIDCDFRLIAATNRNLETMVHADRFRSDLLYRIRTFAIELPPLRKRTEDVHDLIIYFTREVCKRDGIKTKEISPTVFETLTAYPWPGNVRELMGAIDSAVTTARFEPVLYSRHLPENIRIFQARSMVANGENIPETVERQKPKDLPTLQAVRDTAVARVEKDYLVALMETTAGNISAACRISGLSRSRLYDLLKKHDVRSAF